MSSRRRLLYPPTFRPAMVLEISQRPASEIRMEGCKETTLESSDYRSSQEAWGERLPHLIANRHVMKTRLWPQFPLLMRAKLLKRRVGKNTSNTWRQLPHIPDRVRLAASQIVRRPWWHRAQPLAGAVAPRICCTNLIRPNVR